MNNITYYLIKKRKTDEPQTVFRFFEGDRSPEHLGENYEWVSDDSLWSVFGMGDVNDDDIIPEDEALNWIEKWRKQSK